MSEVIINISATNSSRCEPDRVAVMHDNQRIFFSITISKSRISWLAEKLNDKLQLFGPFLGNELGLARLPVDCDDSLGVSPLFLERLAKLHSLPVANADPAVKRDGARSQCGALRVAAHDLFRKS